MCFQMSLSKLKSLENGCLPYCLTETVSAEERGVIQWPPFLLTLLDYSCTQAIYNLVKMSPWAQSPYLSILNREVQWVYVVVREKRRGGEPKKIKNKWIWIEAGCVQSRLTPHQFFFSFISPGVNTSHYTAVIYSNDARWRQRCRASVKRCKRCLCSTYSKAVGSQWCDVWVSKVPLAILAHVPCLYPVYSREHKSFVELIENLAALHWDFKHVAMKVWSYLNT